MKEEQEKTKSKKKQSLKIPPRNPKNILSDENLKFFYEEILLFVESDIKGYGSFNDLKKLINGNEQIKKFQFQYKYYKKYLDKPVINVFYFDACGKKEKSKNNSIINNWFKHLRNAFAHNYITIDEESGCYTLKDFNNENKKQTLLAIIDNIDDFKCLVKTAKSLSYK